MLGSLLEFLRVCQKHGILVGLSGWFRHKEGDSYVSQLKTPEDCAPQFPGMWDDVAWHRALTDCIHQSRVK